MPCVHPLQLQASSMAVLNNPSVMKGLREAFPQHTRQVDWLMSALPLAHWPIGPLAQWPWKASHCAGWWILSVEGSLGHRIRVFCVPLSCKQIHREHPPVWNLSLWEESHTQSHSHFNTHQPVCSLNIITSEVSSWMSSVGKGTQ